MGTASTASKFIISRARGNELADTCILATGQSYLMTKHPKFCFSGQAKLLRHARDQVLRGQSRLQQESSQQTQAATCDKRSGRKQGSLDPRASFLPIRLEIREFPSTPKTHIKIAPGGSIYIDCT